MIGTSVRNQTSKNPKNMKSPKGHIKIKYLKNMNLGNKNNQISTKLRLRLCSIKRNISKQTWRSKLMTSNNCIFIII